MQRQKSEKSRRAVLDAALEAFSTRGYGSTSVRDIAEAAGVSTGNVYHHFPDKQAIFRELIAEYFAISATPRHPFTRVLYSGDGFPENIEELGRAARQSVIEFRSYLALFYVDVIEFKGTHIQQFYNGITEIFVRLFNESGTLDEVQASLRTGVTPFAALHLTTRVFFDHFTLEVLFGVPSPIAGDDAEGVIRQLSDMIRQGVCRSPQ